MRSLPDFPSYFRALWSYDPFPWQTMLAERIAGGSWPQALDLPTAAGKTACIDAAIYALACQADKLTAERTAPRRIWFVVDRRIVVDEAYDRATLIARKLAEATQGPLKDIANSLRQISGTKKPLAVGRLRGGILQNDGWARLPSQPAVITSTVDQVGSRLLFRGYGHSHLTAPIFAGLVAHDSLILLDEVHCSVPFMQTLRSIETYRGGAWAESPLQTPFAFAVLSATPPPGIPDTTIFPGNERDQALDHPVLHDRLQASKPAQLIEMKVARNGQDDPFVKQAVQCAMAYMSGGKKKRVAVIVNRVYTAEETALALREQVKEEADIVLLTGRIRPYERDRLVEKWKPFLKANSPNEPEKPIILVSTQCIEVGADFSFEALVTEAASLDALRQRFGRLNRIGSPSSAPATILMRAESLEDEEPDPIYGLALNKTWYLMKEKSMITQEGKEERKVINFGFESLEATLKGIEDISPYLAPKPDAPVLLPAHLDLLCQTAPPPYPELDVQFFLHGKQRGEPEAKIVWRADISVEDTRTWKETVALCPPISGESLSVPLYSLRSWLANPNTASDAGDFEGAASPDGDSPGDIRPCLLWRGRDWSRVCHNASEILPNDVVIVPAGYGIIGLGQSAVSEATGEHALDLWESVRAVSGCSPALRLHHAILQPWLAWPPLKELVALAEDPATERETLLEGIDSVLDYQQTADEEPIAPPGWLFALLKATRRGRIVDHPTGGVILFAREDARRSGPKEDDIFADDDDLTSASGREVPLSIHSASVERAVEKLATHCLQREFLDSFRLAAKWHDVGKLDERFQILLRGGDELATIAGEPLAKSADIPTSPARRRDIREATGLPSVFRHEMLSAQLAERYADLQESGVSELSLHLIASHHGHARPFAPISLDPEPPALSGQFNGMTIEFATDIRKGLTPPHRLDSGLSERFWRLTRRYGWWGLAYLEAILRLSDWYGSEFIMNETEEGG